MFLHACACLSIQLMLNCSRPRHFASYIFDKHCIHFIVSMENRTLNAERCAENATLDICRKYNVSKHRRQTTNRIMSEMDEKVPNQYQMTGSQYVPYAIKCNTTCTIWFWCQVHSSSQSLKKFPITQYHEYQRFDKSSCVHVCDWVLWSLLSIQSICQAWKNPNRFRIIQRFVYSTLRAQPNTAK